MNVQIEFLKRCKALGLHDSNLPAWLDHIESLRAQIAELKAENERLKTVPMKYRRMEFNAQLQKENDELKRQRDEYKADAERWRAYAKRKSDVIAAGMGRKILRDLEGHDALPAFYKEMEKRDAQGK